MIHPMTELAVRVREWQREYDTVWNAAIEAAAVSLDKRADFLHEYIEDFVDAGRIEIEVRARAKAIRSLAAKEQR